MEPTSPAAGTPLTSTIEERRLLVLLVERELLASSDVAAADAACVAADPADDPRAGRCIDWLVSDGRVAQTDVDRSLADLRFSDAATIDPLSHTHRSDKHLAASAHPDKRQYGPYKLEHLIGKGGCGEVWRADDERLERTVALKLLNLGDAEQHDRLKREAQLQARIVHDNVCKVFEVGEDSGRGYIAMQFIDGADVGEVAPRLPLREIVGLFERVADAVDAAHTHGLIHRDLKPANILVERQRTGGWKPYVVDFGLARETGSMGLTATGIVVGTVHYMAPEQARGDRQLDHRVDIYALGATLYELLCGEPPFDGETPLKVLQQTVFADALPLRKRNPRVPLDLETIVMRCIEKEPARRYASAAALATDLRRFLDGEPIIARPPTLAYRLRLQLQRRRRELMVAAVCLLALGVVVTIQVRQLFVARAEAALMREYDAVLAELEQKSVRMRLAPPHDIEPESTALRRSVEKLATRLEARAPTLGPLARSHGYYVLGRGYEIVGEYDRAKTLLEQAIAAGQPTPRLAAAIGSVYAGLYLAQKSPIDASIPPSVREEERRILERTLREPAMAYLRSAVGNDPDEEVALASARLAVLAGQTGPAIEAASRAKSGHPWLADADAVIAEAHLVHCIELTDQSKIEDAVIACTEAGRAVDAGIEIARSDYALRLLAGRIAGLQLELAARRTKPLDAPYQAMRTAYAAAAIIRPHDPERAAIELMAVVARAVYDTDHGEDPRPYLAPLVAAADADALDRANSWRARLAGHYALAEAALNFGGDPKADVAAGVLAARQLAVHDPGARSDERLALMLREQFEATMAEPAGETNYRELVTLCDRLLAARPDDGDTANVVGVAHMEWAQHLTTKRIDPRPTLTLAAAAFEKSLGRNREAALYNLGAIALLNAEAAMAVGDDPTHWLTDAETQIGSALALVPNDGPFTAGLVATLTSRAGWLMTKDALDDAAAATTRANTACQNGLRTAPHEPELLSRCARNLLLSATIELQRHRDPDVALVQAAAFAERVHAVLPDARDTTNLQARILLARAKVAKSRTAAVALLASVAPLLSDGKDREFATRETELLRHQLAFETARRDNNAAAATAARTALATAIAPQNGCYDPDEKRLMLWL